MAKGYLGKMVDVVCDRPLGTTHPKHGYVYEANYGYVPDTIAPDGEALDAYYLGVTEPVQQTQGVCIAVIHRLNDDDDKLVVVPVGTTLTDEEIVTAVRFQEQWFETKVVR
jgi:inorganic pyrophosphatase